MNYKKALLLPLITLALVGCNKSNPNSGSTSKSGSDDTITVSVDPGTPVTKEECQRALNTAAQSFVDQDSIGLDTKGLEAHIENVAYDLVENEFAKVQDLKVDLPNVALSLRTQGITAEDINKDFLASLALKTQVKLNGKVASDKAENKGQLVDVALDAPLELNAYYVGGDPFINLPKSNQTLIDQVVATAGNVTDQDISSYASMITLPFNVHLINLGIDLSGVRESLKGEVASFIDALDVSEEDILTFQKYSETSYSIYLEKQIENEKVDGDYVLSKEVTSIKAAVLFDTSVGLTSATVEVTDNAYETFAKTIDLEEEASNYTKEQLETKVTVETSHAIGQLNFTYGEQAKPQIDMMELLKYSTIDIQQLLGALISGGGTPLPGSRKE